ncbi:hypothetical protein HD806DRAFT_552712 [Xylariaceae sp. AK1471]|nr:hypothetical protein HD806DRAFT_552712 [Xylariaceae sp. AK1471]
MLKQRFFDEPLGNKGVSRVGPGDTALAVVNALQDDGQVRNGKKVMIAGLERCTDMDVAELWSEALEVAITPAMGDVDGLVAFDERFRSKLGSVWARDMRSMHEFFETEGFGMTQAQHEYQVALLGKPQ